MSDTNIVIKKRRCVKIEELKPISETAPYAYSQEKATQEKLSHRNGPLGIMQPFQYTNYEWSGYKDRRIKLCVHCSQPAIYKIWFKLNGCQLGEELCRSCVDKYVIVSKSLLSNSAAKAPPNE